MPFNTYAEASQYGQVLYECQNDECNHKFYASCVVEEYIHRDQPTRCPECGKWWSELVLKDGKPITK